MPPTLPTSFAAGRYEVDRCLGEGGRKDVYLARDTRLDRPVVVAWIKAAALEDGERERLQREVQALARLGGHPNVVTILDAGEEEDRPYLVTEFMSGESVALWLDHQPDRRLSTADALRVAGQMGEALAHAHKEGILHRDLKPANVWLDDKGNVKLGDFGLALFLDRPRVTTSGSVVGTPEYMSPEQALGQPLGPETDLYALGAMLYEMLAGRPPFLADTPIAVVSQHLHAAPVAPSWHVDGLPHEIDQLVLRLLAKSRDERLPSAETVCEAIHALEGRRFDSGPLDAPKRNPLDRLARGLFVGRAEEMSKLRGALEEAFAGRASLSLVAGEAGIGKTRLAQEICTYARLRGAQTLFGRCYEGGAAPAFWPFAQVLRDLVEEGGREIQDLARGEAAPILAQVLAEHEEAPADGDGESPGRFRLFDGVARFLAAASRHRPLQIVVDDLHWGDGPSLALLQFLVRELDQARISILVTYRDAEIEPRGLVAKCIASLRRASRSTPLELRGLIPTDVRALVESTEGRSMPSQVLDRIVSDTEGNPFFVEEMLRNFEEGNELEAPGAESAGAPGSLPEGVRDVIGQRLARLSEECQDVLVAAAAIGREFGLALLERVSGVERGALLGLLDEAESARVVAEVPGVLGDWRFEHALMRETLYDRLRTVERIELHRRIGEALEGMSQGAAEPPLAELAHHFHQAALGGSADKAVDYAIRAGRAAVDGLAFEEAALQFGRAFELSGYVSEPDPVERCRHLLAQAEAYHRCGDREASQEAFLRAAGMARSLRGAHPEASATALGRAAFGLGGIWGTVGVLEQPVVDLLAEAVSVQEGDSALHARLLARLSVAYYWSDQVERRLDLSRQAREMAARAGDPTTRIYVLDASHFALWGPDTLEERLTLAGEMVELASEYGELGSATPGSGHFWRIIDQLEAGDIVSVDRDIETYSRLAEQWKQPHFHWYASVARAMRALLAGRLEEGKRLAEESFALGEGSQGENAAHFFAVQQIEIARLEGELASLVEPATAMVRRYPAIPAWRAALTALQASLGEFDAARDQLDRLAANSFEDVPRDANFLVIGYFLAEAVWILKDEERAALLYEMLSPFGAHNVVLGNAAVCVGSVSHSLGRLAAILGKDEEAAEHFTRAISTHRSMGARPAEARTQVAYADALLTTGAGATVPERRERAHGFLDAAFATGDALSLPGINADAQGVLDRTGSTRPSVSEAPVDAAAIPPVEGVLLREGEYWTIGWRGKVFRLKDALGLRYLSRLLAVPGEELHCADLFAGVGPSPSGNLPKAEVGLGVRAAMDEDAGEMLDPQAKEAYRARLRDLQEEIAEAESFNDSGRLERAQAEMEALQNELARGVGLGGRDRKASSRKEQARLSVTRAIRSVLRKVEKASPELGEHLSATVKTGTFCSYTPDPRVPLRWNV